MGRKRSGAVSAGASLLALACGIATGLNFTLLAAPLPVWPLWPALAAGALFVAGRTAPERVPPFAAPFTVALAAVAVGQFALAALVHDPRAHPAEIRDVMSFVYFTDLFVAAACVAVAGLRLRRARLAAPMTCAIQPLLLFAFPFGTAAFFAWLLRVRKREPLPR